MNSKDYWKTRSLLLEALLNNRAEETVQIISRLYGLALEDIYRQIERIFQRYVKGGALSEEEALRMLTVRETEQMREELFGLLEQSTGTARQEIWARLSAPAYASRISRLQALRDRLYAQCRVMGLEEVGYVRDRLADTLEQSYYRTIFDAQQFTGNGFAFDRLRDNQTRAALAADWNGKHWSARIWDNNSQFADAVQDTVTVGLMTGQRYDQMRDNLLHVIGMDETEGARYKAARLVKTECAYIANQGHLMGYRQAGIQTYIYLATLDLRTSEICRSLDMKRFPVDEAQAGTNLPPMHPHCRSTTMPDTDVEILRKIKRPAKDPVTGESITVPGNMSYRQWYHQYVAGNPDALAMEAAAKNRSADREQFRQYRAVLGENAPKSLDEFQRVKYTDGERWEDLKKQRISSKTAAGKDRTVRISQKMTNSDKADMTEATKEESVIAVHSVGNIDPNLFRCVTEDISSDEVIITDERIAHIEDHHPGDYELLKPFFAQALEHPDYILRDKKNQTNTGLVLKWIEQDDLRFQMVLRLKTSSDPKEYKNSIISAWHIGEARWNNYVKNKEILYRRE